MRKISISTLRECENIKDHYYITDSGEVISESSRPCILRPIIMPNGYLRVRLHINDGSKKQMSVHRLVALAFVGNLDFEIYNLVNHKNGNKQDNYYTNLEWSDIDYNCKHAQELGNWGVASYPQPVVATDVDTGIEYRFPSIRQAAIWVGRQSFQSEIRRCLSNEKSQAYGYTWRHNT